MPQYIGQDKSEKTRFILTNLNRKEFTTVMTFMLMVSETESSRDSAYIELPETTVKVTLWN